MTVTVTDLLSHCLANNESPKQFRILYNQLTHRQHIEPIELFNNLEKSLQYYYIYEVFNFDFGLSKIFEILQQRDLEQQLFFIKLLSQERSVIRDLEFDENFNKYLKITLPLYCQKDDFIIDISIFITSHKINIHQDLMNQLLDASSGNLLLSKQNASSSNIKLNLYKFIKVKKFVWLNYLVLNYQLQDKVDDFVNSFIKLINNSSLNFVFTELLSSSFECMNVASENPIVDEITTKNWEFFITNKLPLIFQSSLKINQENFEIILDKSLPSLQNFDIKLNFLKSLISLKMIKLEKFYHLIGTTDNVIEINELLKYQNESQRELTRFQEFNFIQDLITKNLIESNPEFTNIDDDNKLYTFMKSFNLNNIKLRLEFANIIFKTIVQLCDDNDSTRLRRLMFCLSSNLATLDTFIFNSKPQLVLEKLIEICCNSEYLNGTSTGTTRGRKLEDVSMFGEEDDDDDNDDENYQELYTDFSCILIHIMFIARRYHLVIPTDNLFILNLLNQFAISSSMISDDSNLQNLREWYNSIYNDNESLISDELIAKTNLTNSFQLIPVIFSNSMIQYNQGAINFELLMNGFEFFMQPFLILNLIPIFYKLNEVLWLNNGSELVWKIINKILNLKLEGESKLMFQLIWNYLSVDLQHWKTFRLTSNQDYVEVMNFFGNSNKALVDSRIYHLEFLKNLNALVTSNSTDLKLSIYKDVPTDCYKIFQKIIHEIGSILSFSVANLKEDKNNSFINYLEISSFNLLVLFEFDKQNITNLQALINNEPLPRQIKVIDDLKFLIKTCSNSEFDSKVLIKLIEKIIQHLSNL